MLTKPVLFLCAALIGSSALAQTGLKTDLPATATRTSKPTSARTEVGVDSLGARGTAAHALPADKGPSLTVL